MNDIFDKLNEPKLLTLNEKIQKMINTPTIVQIIVNNKFYNIMKFFGKGTLFILKTSRYWNWGNHFRGNMQKKMKNQIFALFYYIIYSNINSNINNYVAR